MFKNNDKVYYVKYEDEFLPFMSLVQVYIDYENINNEYFVVWRDSNYEWLFSGYVNMKYLKTKEELKELLNLE